MPRLLPGNQFEENLSKETLSEMSVFHFAGKIWARRNGFAWRIHFAGNIYITYIKHFCFLPLFLCSLLLFLSWCFCSSPRYPPGSCPRMYSVMQSDGNTFCGGVVLDSFNMKYMNEDSILDKKIWKQIFWYIHYEDFEFWEWLLNMRILKNTAHNNKVQQGF